MKVLRAERMMFPSDAATARRFAESNLLSIHGRKARLLALARRPHLDVREETPHLRADALRLVSSALKDSPRDWLLLGDYDTRSRQRSLLFVFDDGHLERVIKIRPSDAPGTSLAHEGRLLQALHPKLDADIARTVPEVIELAERDGHEILALSACPGQPLLIRMQRSLRPIREHAPDLAAAGRWLGELHAQTADDGGPAVHGDFWMRNLLSSGGGVLGGVVDWERGEISGESGRDLFTLPLLYATDSPSWWARNAMDRYRQAFHGNGGLARIVRGYFVSYAAAAEAHLDELRDRFDRWLRQNADRSKEGGWESRYPWAGMLAITRNADRSVFSG